MNIKSSQQLVEEANKTIETLSPMEVKSLVEKNEITLIDVRDMCRPIQLKRRTSQVDTRQSFIYHKT